jgi:diguanylate cyclase (GGDEF)-like protein/PAS domain S-box-containing protein
MWVYDLETLGFLAVNDAAVPFYGRSREQFLSRTIFDIRPVDDCDELREIIGVAGYEFEDRSWRHRKANGTTIDANVYTQAVTYEGHAGALVTMIDVTTRRQAEARISHMAHHDAMTGLANRSLLQLSINDALVRVRYGGRIALLCIDLDRFKEVNYLLGHALGDELLRIVSKRLRGCVREGDTVVRLGGDEFAIVQCGIESPDDASAPADRIIEAISKPFEIKGHSVIISVCQSSTSRVSTSPSGGFDGGHQYIPIEPRQWFGLVAQRYMHNRPASWPPSSAKCLMGELAEFQRAGRRALLHLPL